MNTATEIVAPRMQSLQKLEKTLKKLDLSWKVIETTARVVSPPQVAGYIETLEHTRLAFSQLAREMVEQMALTHLQNGERDLASKAQVAIDMLVRNLFANGGHRVTPVLIERITDGQGKLLFEAARPRIEKATAYLEPLGATRVEAGHAGADLEAMLGEGFEVDIYE